MTPIRDPSKKRKTAPESGRTDSQYGRIPVAVAGSWLDTDNFDNEETPKQAAGRRIIPLHFPSEDLQLSRTQPSETDSEKGTETSSQAPSRKSRSRSPKKSVLQNSLEGFDFRDFDGIHAGIIPDGLKHMLLDILNLSRNNIGVLPRDVKVRILIL